MSKSETLPQLSKVMPKHIHTNPVAIDLFAGAGGLSQGFIDAGFTIAAVVDNDPSSIQTQTNNHCQGKSLTQAFLSDIKCILPSKLIDACKMSGKDRPDVLMGGPPCQGYSRSNTKTRTIDNPLNHLFRDFLLLAAELKPHIIVMENVADFAKFCGGSLAEEIKNTLQEMNARYNVVSKVLCASDYGVPQRRNRVFFVAYEPNLTFEFPKPRIGNSVSLWEAISDLPELPNGNLEESCLYRCPPKNAYQQLMRNNMSETVSNNRISSNSELIIQRYRHIKEGENWESIPDELMSNYKDKSKTHNWIYLRLKSNEPSVTITHFRKSMLIHPYQERGLSVREAARIQSFKDDFIFCGSLMHQQQQVANAVPPLLAQAVAQSVRNTLGF
jgi:DNA (cytosine-5)-methyltransferase 1